MQQKWYKSWFNSPYYHILYNSRNDQEAEHFMDNLMSFLVHTDQSRVLDIACGKGRHAIYLRKKGLDVTGIDLSENSIAYAKKFEDEKLHFFVHDMRKLLNINYFDIALNLFTSFGYFETDNEHIKALKAFKKGLNNKGVLVLDYFNTNKVVDNLQPFLTKHTAGIDFTISKSLVNGKILKNIQFEDQGEKFDFTERVHAYTLDDFKRILKESQLKIDYTFGDYDLNEFDAKESDRLIMICSKV